jgi:hypothetical protein
MKKTKLMTISVVLIVALGLTGIAYAHWFDQVHIEGKVHGGTVNIAFSTREPPQCLEYYTDLDGVTHNGEFLGKQVGDCEAWYDELVTDPHTDKDGYKKLIVEIDNAYPSYEPHITHIIHNIGTIPFLVCEYIITGQKLTKEDVFIYNLIYVPTQGEYCGELWEDVDGDDKVDPAVDKLVINICLVNGILPYQLDPCNENKQEWDLHFKQPAQQCHRYRIQIELKVVQWNKECLDVWPAD